MKQELENIFVEQIKAVDFQQGGIVVFRDSHSVSQKQISLASLSW